MSALTKDSERAIRTIVWDGKQNSYLIWSEKFMANAKRRGYKEVMTGNLKVPKADKVLDEDDTDDAKEIKVRDMKDLGYVDLILSMSDTEVGGIALSYIKNAKTDALPDGDLQRAWEALEKKYFSKTSPVANALSKKFQDLKHKKGSDPDIWITQLEDIKIRLDSIGKAYEMPDEQFMAHVINNVSKVYESTVDFLGQRMQDANSPLTLEEARGYFLVRIQRLCSQKEDKDTDNNGSEEEKDIALFVKGKFKEQCNKCGKIGHKSVDCRVTNTDSYRYNNSNTNTNNSHTHDNNGNHNGNTNHHSERSSNGYNRNNFGNTNTNNNRGPWNSNSNHCNNGNTHNDNYNVG
jgi:gag-polypeptide of LTR copia-type